MFNWQEVPRKNKGTGAGASLIRLIFGINLLKGCSNHDLGNYVVFCSADLAKYDVCADIELKFPVRSFCCAHERPKLLRKVENLITVLGFLAAAYFLVFIKNTLSCDNLPEWQWYQFYDQPRLWFLEKENRCF